MAKVKLTISIEEEIAKDLRTRSIEKYGNSRSLSQLIEDMTKDGYPYIPTIEEIKNARIEYLAEIMGHPDNSHCGSKPSGEPGFCGKKPYVHFKCWHCGKFFDADGAPTRCPYCETYTIFIEHHEDHAQLNDYYRCSSCGELIQCQNQETPTICPRCYSREINIIPDEEVSSESDTMKPLYDAATRVWASR